MDVALGEIKTEPRARLRLAYCAFGKKVSRGTLLKVLGWDAFGTPIVSDATVTTLEGICEFSV